MFILENRTFLSEQKSLLVDAVSSGYGKSLVVDNITISVDRNQIVTIIGANGSGKSTLLKTIIGLIKPYSGRIKYEGENIENWSVDEIVRRGLGYVPQVKNTFPNLSVRENLRIGGYYLKGDALISKLEEILSLFPELREYEDTKVELLSGGERQMVAFGRSLMASPRVLLLDEPTAALSPIVTSKVLEKIVGIRNSGVSVLMVEQNARKALSISDYAYAMLSGKVVVEGTGKSLENDKDLGRTLMGIK